MYFKDKNNQVFWYDDDQMDLVGDKTPLTEDEVNNHLYPIKTQEQRITEIKTELAVIDQRRIRPLAEGDTEYLATLNAQAVALRAELQGLMEA